MTESGAGERRGKVLVCSCERTMAVDRDAIESATGLDISKVHRQLCRDETYDFLRALDMGAPVQVACTQEARFFQELVDDRAEQNGEEQPPVGFFNIRELAGWSADGRAREKNVNAKMAALVAAAEIPQKPSGSKSVVSEGVCLVYGRGQTTIDIARKLSTRLSVNVLLLDASGAIPPATGDVPIHSGRIVGARGSLGDFELVVDGYAPMIPSSREKAEFVMARDGASTVCDLVLDITGDTPLFPAADKRDGYFRADPGSPVALAEILFEITDYVGTFEKPLYVTYNPDICAHSRSKITGCSNCLDNCPAGAISSIGNHVEIDPGLCAGCGACSAVCPTGAVSYDYPRREDLISRLQTLIGTYLDAGGTRPVLLIHDESHGTELISAMARFGRGLPGNVLPLSVFSVTETGHEALTAAFVAGAEQIVVLASPRAVEDLPALESQGDLVSAFLGGLGHGHSGRIRILVESDPDEVEAALHGLEERPEMPRATFQPVGGKRDIARAALGKLRETAPLTPDILPLPDSAPYGRIEIDTEGCTLCLACVSACPAGALFDSPDKPQVRFQEQACVQCGLCASTCPENVITLEPRVNFTPEAMTQVTLNEDTPFECIRCGKKFGSAKTIERIAGQLSGAHWMFQRDQDTDLIRMCDDCRVEMVAERGADPFASAERPRVLTTEDYLEAEKRGLTIDDFLSED